MSDDKRAMMAAHLCEEAASAYRVGDTDRGGALQRGAGRMMGVPYPPERFYRVALSRTGLTPEQIDAAVASVERGEWPVDSLAGKIEAAHRKALHALTLAPAKTEATHAAKISGEIIGLMRVSEWIGAKP